MKICRMFPTFQVDFKYTEHYLAKELYKKGHTTTFVTSDKYLSSWKSYLKTQDGVGHRSFEYFDVNRLAAYFPNEKVIFKNWFALYRILFKKDFQVLHLLGLGTFTTYTVLFLSLFRNKKKLPLIIVSDHSDTRTHAREGTLADLYHFFFKLLYKIFGGRIKTIVSFSQAGADVLSKRYGISQNRFTIIPLGYDSEEYFFNPSLKNADSKFVIGFAGKIDEKKKVDLLLKAAAATSVKNDLKLIIVGAKEGLPYTDFLKNLAYDLQLDVEFRPFASSQELAIFYNHINLAVYPGGISITTIEANGCGTPVVVYRSIANLENRVENGRGKLFSQPEELVQLIEWYYEQYKANLIDYRQIATTTANTSSWSVINNEYLDIYQNQN